MRAVKRAAKIPVAVKLSPYFSSTGHMARRLVDAGADGLVLFNRFYQPDFDLATLDVKSELTLSSQSRSRAGRCSGSACSPAGVRASLAATSGVETVEQVVKYLLVGADVVMTTSALLRHGPSYMTTLVAGLAAWLDQNAHCAVSAIRGRNSIGQLDDAGELLRAQYMRLLTDYVPRQLAA